MSTNPTPTAFTEAQHSGSLITSPTVLRLPDLQGIYGDAQTQLGEELGISALELLDLSADVLLVVNEVARLEYVSGGVTRLTGREPKEWVGASIIELVHPDDVERALDRFADVLAGAVSTPHEFRVSNGSDDWLSVEVLGRCVETVAGERKIVITLRNTAERRSLLERVQWQASHDELSGLYSLVGLQQHCLSEEGFDSSETIVVIRVDVNGFQRINEFYGHRSGDEAIRLMGTRLAAIVGDEGVPARLGGDDFIVVGGCPAPVKGETEHDAAMNFAAMIGEHLTGAYVIDGVTVELNFRVGLACINGPGALLTGIAEAEAALSHAKTRELDVYLFDDEMRRTTDRRRKLELALREELRTPKRLGLEFQSVVDASSRRVVSFEGLARWTTPTGVSICPSEFVPIAEATSLMAPLTKHVLRVGVEQLAKWSSEGIEDSTISVNVPVSQMQRPEFLPFVGALLEEYSVRPRRLIIEVTESTMIERLDLVRSTLENLRGLGCTLAIDDFGTGYSSFSWLRELPVDIIKIDQSFVAPLTTTPSAVPIMRSLVDLCKRLGFQVTAEGVETRQQADLLTSLGVDRMQGYAFGPSRPSMVAGLLFGKQADIAL